MPSYSQCDLTTCIIIDSESESETELDASKLYSVAGQAVSRARANLDSCEREIFDAEIDGIRELLSAYGKPDYEATTNVLIRNGLNRHGDVPAEKWDKRFSHSKSEQRAALTKWEFIPQPLDSSECNYVQGLWVPKLGKESEVVMDTGIFISKGLMTSTESKFYQKNVRLRNRNYAHQREPLLFKNGIYQGLPKKPHMIRLADEKTWVSPLQLEAMRRNKETARLRRSARLCKEAARLKFDTAYRSSGDLEAELNIMFDYLWPSLSLYSLIKQCESRDLILSARLLRDYCTRRSTREQIINELEALEKERFQ